MRRPLRLIVSLLAAVTMLGGSLAAVSAATTVAPTTTCANGMDNTGGLGLICEVTVVNTITDSGGSATVTVRECHGAAGDPEADCTITTDVLTEPVTAVTQCNDAINGGGGTLRCSVQVTNNFSGPGAAPTAVTVNQCVGSGDGVANTCDPFPATTTGATVTQCNGSANGGTLVELTCTATGTQSAGLAVTINQCNRSANGGGAFVICSAELENNVVAPSAPAASRGPVLSAPPTDTVAATVVASDASAWTTNPLLALLLLAAVIGAATFGLARRR